MNSQKPRTGRRRGKHWRQRKAQALSELPVDDLSKNNLRACEACGRFGLSGEPCPECGHEDVLAVDGVPEFMGRKQPSDHYGFLREMGYDLT